MKEEKQKKEKLTMKRTLANDWYALKLTRLMGAKTSTWTLKDPAHYEQVKGEFDLYTFEGFPMQ